MFHLNHDDLGLEVIQIQANRVGKLRMTDFLLNGNNVTAALDHVLDESQVASVVRVGPNESLKPYVLECVGELVALHITSNDQNSDDPAHQTLRRQRDRDGRVRCSALGGGITGSIMMK